MRYLDFEESLIEIDNKIKNNIPSEIESILEEISFIEHKIYDKLKPENILKIARHMDRPYSLDYIENIFDEYSEIELHGDRMFRDDPAILGYLGKIDNKKVLVIGIQKGRDILDKKYRNFGMPHPEGYRKAIRLIKLAEKFNIPVVMLIDTPGAYPGIGAEERGQSNAIANNLLELSDVKVPTISIVIGEGGSGGALAIGVADKLAMLEYSIFSVISPEGCSSILWKDSEHTIDAMNALKITSTDLLKQGLVDDIINEGPGGAHRYPVRAFNNVKKYILEQLTELQNIPTEELLDNRYTKFRNYSYKENR